MRPLLVPLAVATAKCTSPTGFSAVPPPGPATPVIDSATSTASRERACSAMLRATSSLTAPYRSSSALGNGCGFVLKVFQMRCSLLENFAKGFRRRLGQLVRKGDDSLLKRLER